MTQNDAKSGAIEAPEAISSERDLAIALELVRGNRTQDEIATAFEVSRSTVTRLAASDWFRSFREKVLENAAAAAKQVFEDFAGQVAAKLVTIALNGESDTARKACVDVLEAAGVEMSKDGGAPRIRIT